MLSHRQAMNGLIMSHSLFTQRYLLARSTFFLVSFMFRWYPHFADHIPRDFLIFWQVPPSIGLSPGSSVQFELGSRCHSQVGTPLPKCADFWNRSMWAAMFEDLEPGHLNQVLKRTAMSWWLTLDSMVQPEFAKPSVFGVTNFNQSHIFIYIHM